MSSWTVTKLFQELNVNFYPPGGQLPPGGQIPPGGKFSQSGEIPPGDHFPPHRQPVPSEQINI